jgi:outer membrane biogenesis lipoprotein LolB
MFKKPLLISAMASSLLLACNLGFAADPPMQSQAQEQIYGSQLMSAQERTEYQARMRATKTNEEREQIRAQHHKEMQVRARQQGVTLPAEPPAHGMGGGMGPGGGAGGMGSGGGGSGGGGR